MAGRGIGELRPVRRIILDMLFNFLNSSFFICRMRAIICCAKGCCEHRIIQTCTGNSIPGFLRCMSLCKESDGKWAGKDALVLGTPSGGLRSLDFMFAQPIWCGEADKEKKKFLVLTS